MASGRRTTVVLTPADQRALAAASRRAGLSQSELIRLGIRRVTAAYTARVKKPTVGWLVLSRGERAALLADEFGDPDE